MIYLIEDDIICRLTIKCFSVKEYFDNDDKFFNKRK